MNKKTIKSKFFGFVLLVLVLNSLLLGFAPYAPQAEAAAAPAGENIAALQAEHEAWVTTTADSGEGSLREAMQQARPGTVIRFDPAVFPEANPATIMLKSGLPELATGEVTIDAQGAGAILDGSLLGNEPEQAFVDDISLSFDGGPNLLENGGFSPNGNFDHWQIWQTYDVENFRWNEDEGVQEPGCFEWTGTNRQFYISLIYQLTRPFFNSSGDGGGADYSNSVFLPLDGAETIDLRFWYRYGNLSANLSFVTEFGEWGNVHQGFEYADFWDQAVFRVEVPEGADSVALEISVYPTQYAHGLIISSDNNIIQGLKIINFPGSGIEINGSDNVIGVPNPWMEAGCGGTCNLLSGNMEAGVMINGGGGNIIQGNYIGVDQLGVTAMKNGLAGVRIFDSNDNQIGGSFSQGEGNLISGNSIGIEINSETGVTVAENNIIQGNLIGTDFSGMEDVRNGAGVSLGGSSYTLIGGDDPDLRNIISGNQLGISMNGSAHHNLVLGNYIGTDITGLSRLKNDYVGVEMINGAYSNQVGGTETGEANVISGNGDAGVLLRDFESKDNLVTGNWIGIGADGETPVPNRTSGVYIENTTNHQIGPGNRIANNGDAGVNIQIEGVENGNTITQNSITNNQAAGIRVNVTEEDALPAAEDVTVSKRSVTGTAPAGTTLEFYQDAKDEGEIYLGTIEADDKGRFSWVAPVGTLLSENITALATNSAGTTGGFSKPAVLPGAFLAEIPGLPGPEQVSLKLNVLSLNAIIALVAMLFFGVVGTWFNESLENFSEEITLAVKKFLCKLKLARCEAGADVKPASLRDTLLKWLLILGVTAFIQTFLDPGVRFDRAWWGQLTTLILSGLLVTGLQIASEWLLRRLSAGYTEVRVTEVSGIGLVMAIMSVLFSRVMRFSPGMVLGTVDGLYCNPQLEDPRQDGQRALAAKGAVLGLTFLGWLLSPLFDGQPGIQSLLITMFVIGIQYAFFELIPLKVLDGYVVRVWDKWIWRLSFFISMLGFVYLCVNPDTSDLGDFRENSLLSLGIIAGVLLLVSLALRIFLGWIDKDETKHSSDTESRLDGDSSL